MTRMSRLMFGLFGDQAGLVVIDDELVVSCDQERHLLARTCRKSLPPPPSLQGSRKVRSRPPAPVSQGDPKPLN